jgi:hypothetical protein
MAATKITVNHNGSIRIEGDFEILDPEGKPFGLAGRWVAQDQRIRGYCRCPGAAFPQTQALRDAWVIRPTVSNVETVSV